MDIDVKKQNINLQKLNKYFTNIRDKARHHKVLIQNFSYLSALQIFNLLLPLITYPYLIRVLGADQYGLVIYAQVISAYFGILIDFGFRLSATKEISIHRNDRNKLSEIVSSVYIIKFVLWLFSFIVLIAMVNFIPGLKQEKWLFIFSFALCFNELLFPQWYFQGVERMKYITIINLIARLTFLALIFIVVKTREDYLYVPLLNGFGAFIGGILGLYVLFYNDQIKFQIQPFNNLIYYLRQSFPLFGSYAIISVKDRFNIIFIGTFLSMKDVVIYDLAIKIMGMLVQPIDIINNTIFPKISKDKDMKLMIRIATYTSVFIFILIIALQPFISIVVNFLAKGLTEAILPTRLLMIAPLIMVWSFSLGRNCLIVHGQYKLFTLGMILTTMFYLLMIGCAIIFSINNFLFTYIIITILTYLFELLYRWYIAKRLNLI